VTLESKEETEKVVVRKHTYMREPLPGEIKGKKARRAARRERVRQLKAAN